MKNKFAKKPQAGLDVSFLGRPDHNFAPIVVPGVQAPRLSDKLTPSKKDMAPNA